MQTHKQSPLLWGPLLPGAMASATLIYAMTSVLAPDIIEEFDFSKARLGWVLAIFSIVSAVLSPLAGRITDRIGSRKAMLGIFTSGAAGFLFFSQAVGFYTLVASGLVLALGQALANPATNKLIATEFEPGKRGLVTGIKQSGVQVGTLIAGASFPAIAAASDWQRVPALVGLFFLAVAVISWFILPHEKAPVRNETAGHEGPAVTQDLPRSVPLLAVYALLMGLGGSTLFAFLPLFAVEQIDISKGAAGILVAISGAFGAPARVGSAILADRSGKPLPLLAVLSFTSVAATASMLAANLGGYIWLAIGAALIGLGVSSWNSVAMLAVINDAGPELAGRASGIVLAGFLSGLAISPPLFGFSVDYTGTYNWGFLVVGMLFTLAALVAISAVRAGR